MANQYTTSKYEYLNDEILAELNSGGTAAGTARKIVDKKAVCRDGLFVYLISNLT